MGNLVGWNNDAMKVTDGTTERTVFDDDGALYQGGTALTPTAAEINKLAGLAAGATIVGSRFTIPITFTAYLTQVRLYGHPRTNLILGP